MVLVVYAPVGNFEGQGDLPRNYCTNFWKGKGVRGLYKKTLFEGSERGGDKPPPPNQNPGYATGRIQFPTDSWISVTTVMDVSQLQGLRDNM